MSPLIPIFIRQTEHRGNGLRQCWQIVALHPPACNARFWIVALPYKLPSGRVLFWMEFLFIFVAYFDGWDIFQPQNPQAIYTWFIQQKLLSCFISKFFFQKIWSGTMMCIRTKSNINQFFSLRKTSRAVRQLCYQPTVKLQFNWDGLGK